MKTLIVDDSQQDRRLLRHYLENNNCQVVEAPEGETALRMARACPPDLIISDALMPKMDGFQLLRHIRKDTRLFEIPFIFYSAVFTEKTAQDLALSLGADAYLVKPKKADEFWRELSQILDGCRLKSPRSPSGTLQDETEFLTQYSDLVATKLEEKLEQLQQSEERYRSMVEMSPDWIWELDKDFTFTYVSPRIRDLLGFEPDELLGQSAFSPMTPDEAKRVRKELIPFAKAREPFSGLININRHKDGHPVIIESSGVPMFDREGIFRGYRGIDRDVTQRVLAEKERLQFQTQFQTTFEMSALGMCLLSEKGHILQANRRFCDMLGYTNEEILKADWPRLTHPDDVASSKAAMARGISGEVDHYSLEKRFIHRDGHVVWGRLNTALVRDEQGEISFFIAAIEDITDRKVAETTLKLTQRCVDEATDAIFWLDSDQRFRYVNQAACRSLGYTAAELLQMRITDITSTDIEADWPSFWDRVRVKGHLRFECIQRHKDGTEFPVDVMTSYLRYDDTELLHAYVRDISTQRKQQVELQAAIRSAVTARNELKAILRSLTDAVVVTDEDGCVTFLNDQAERIFGGTLATLKGHTLVEITGNKTMRSHISGEAHDQNHFVESQLEMTDHASGERRTFQARTGHVFARKDAHPNHVTIFRDITRERESDRLKNEFIATAAHELRTPLTAILGYAELISEDRDHLSPHHREYFEGIIERSETLEKLIDQLLNLSRIESGRALLIEPGEEDLVDLITHTLDQFKSEQRKGRFQLNLGTDSVPLWIDGDKINQVLENLVTNAIKYSPQDQPITISLKEEDDEVILCIEDRGIGMTAEELDHVFEKFYRADSSDTAVRGLGLGMSIAKMIVEEHHGSIWVESQKGKGTRAYVSLPRHEMPPRTMGEACPPGREQQVHH